MRPLTSSHCTFLPVSVCFAVRLPCSSITDTAPAIVSLIDRLNAMRSDEDDLHSAQARAVAAIAEQQSEAARLEAELAELAGDCRKLEGALAAMSSAC